MSLDLLPAETTKVVTGTLTAAGQDVTAPCVGYSTAIITIWGTYAAPILTVYGTDGVIFAPLRLMTPVGTVTTTGAVSPSANSENTWIVDVSGFSSVQLYATAGPASGSIAVTISLSVGANNVVPPAVDTELPAAGAATADGLTSPTAPAVRGVGYAYNGTNWDRIRTNLDGTAIASGARTATNNSADIVNYNGRGVILTLNVTAITATPLLQVNVQGKDPISATYYKLGADPTAVGATGFFVYEFYPGQSAGVAGGITARTPSVLPRTWRVIATHGDTDSITYSVGYSLIV